MKTKLLCICIFSLIFLNIFGQKKQDSVAKWHYKPNLIAGVDLLNSGISFFSDRKVFQGFVSSQIKGRIHARIDAGYEKNVYQKGGYDAKVSGPFAKIGGFYMMMQDPENQLNGFYLGSQIGASFFRQNYDAVPVRGYGGAGTSVAFPQSSQFAGWIEAVAGGRVQIFSSPFYIDVTVSPKYLVYATKQEDIKPMIVPGFGKSSTKFGIGFTWSLAYGF